MDCEGCEYDILSEDEEIFGVFKRIQIEFHHGHKEIARKLRNLGFEVSLDIRGSYGYVFAEK